MGTKGGKKIYRLFLLLLSVGTLVAGLPRFENHITMEKHRFVLNGHGVREKFWIDLYAVALYLPQKSRDAEKIIRADEPQLMRLVIVSSLISKKRMKKGIEEGFEKSTHGHTEALKERIGRFTEAFGDHLGKKDRLDLFYEPGKGVTVLKNGKPMVTLKGHDFKEALWGIWLGKEPVQKDLKEKLLAEK